MSHPCMLLAQAAAAPSPGGDVRLWIVVLVFMALAPFVLMMVTSFLKLVIVGGLIRTALGTQQIPPNQVIVGLAMILSIHVMWPIGSEIAARYQAYDTGPPATTQPARPTEGWSMIGRAWHAAREPMTAFLLRHSHAENIALFESLQQKLRASRSATNAAASPLSAGVEAAGREIAVLVPAFVLSELSEAFWIGVLIFVPMLVIDLVVANVLLALGMHMMSPVTVALPLKLLLFVLVDGWQLVVQNVVLSYV